ncbi:MAG TPA: Ech hydrogenase subunit EchB [Fibrobacteres bacterium]|jgi:ech hydrogenase subunit B|nr:Ech hydrogenase subunit EchB [Fibrobacterota bacterium]
MKIFIMIIAYLFGGLILGGLLAGFDRILTARMQSRKGPPVFQPFYDVLKLLAKKNIVVNKYQTFCSACFLVFIILTGELFFTGGDLLLAIFALTVAGIFLVIGAYSVNSPYSTIGAQRELLQMMAYEPALLITALGLYWVTKSFQIHEIVSYTHPLIICLPGIFLSLLFILTIKFRKSPFDLSTSHHGHQELVKGLTTEFSGPSLAMIEVAHWYENIFLLGIVYLFFAFNPIIGIAAVIVSYILEVLIDNVFARLTWQFTLASSWIFTGATAVVNLMALTFFLK